MKYNSNLLEKNLKFIKTAVRHFLVGFLIGTFFIPVSPSILYSQSLLSEDQKNLRETAKPDNRNIDDIEQSIEKARFIRYQQNRWNEMRRRLESGESHPGASSLCPGGPAPKEPHRTALPGAAHREYR